MAKPLSYFVSDVHLGLQVGDPAARESAFVAFLRRIDPAQTEALYLLGDIWDFWYEYRDVVPRCGVRVLAALLSLMDAGVKVYFFQGNHDIWTYSCFAELGMYPLKQPFRMEVGGKRFCIGHGDGLGPGMWGYKLMRSVFHCRLFQRLFSTLHPWLAFRMGQGWSRRSRLGRRESYVFKGADEPLYRWCCKVQASVAPADFFIFGHYHCRADIPVDGSARLVLLGDWITQPNWIVYNADTQALTSRVDQF